MTEWQTIERVELRGGPRDGDRLEGADTKDLADFLDLVNGEGEPVRYRKSGQYMQLGAVDPAIPPYARHWYYDWVESS